jgi:hypothetical protein
MTTLKLDTIALGWASSATLVVMMLLCQAAAFAFPGWPLAHVWLTLFSAAEIGTMRNLAEGVAFSLIMGWIVAIVLASVYNRLAVR